MTIRTSTQLQQFFADNINRAITPEMVRDFADSVIAVGGTLYGTNQSLSVTTTWEPVDVFTDSIDTRGITEDLANGRFTIGTGADGVYSVQANLCIDSPASGDLELAIVKNGALTPYQVTYSVQSGIKVPFPIGGTGNLVATDHVGLAIRASGNTTVTLVHGSLRLTRI